MVTCFETSMERAKAHLEKGDQAKEKSEQHYISAGLELKVAKENLPKGLPWAKAVLDYGIHKVRANQLIRIADGRTTVEAERAAGAERERESNGRQLTSIAALISQDDSCEMPMSRREAELADVRYTSAVSASERNPEEFLRAALRRVADFIALYERAMKTKTEKAAFRRELARIYGNASET